MDFNRPVFDEIERPASEDSHENETPTQDPERVKSAKSIPQSIHEEQENLEDVAGQESDEKVEKKDANEEEEGDVALVDENNDKQASQEVDATEQNQNISMDQTIDETSNIENNESQIQGANETVDSEQADSSETKESRKKDNEKKSAEALHQRREAARRHRANKIADGNLILEEEDDLNERLRSPTGLPPLEPISQVLDDGDNIKNNQRQRHDLDLLRINSPDKMDVTLDDDYQEIEVEVKPTREELIAKYQSVIEEKERLQNANNLLHHKLADYFRKKKSDETQNQPLFDKSSQEQEQRYLKYLATIESLKKQIESNRLDAELELDDIKLKCEMREDMVEKERINFIKIKRDAGLRSISTRTGRVLTQKDVDFYLERERNKEKEVIAVRIENIKLKNQLKKKEMELKAKEEFGEGLHMIDFEQLKIENQTYNEKIEERNEELMKLKKKVNNTVQILSHVKEKLKFVSGENDKEKLNLSELDEQLKKNRDALNKMKQSRDSLRMDNAKLKQNSGLLGNTVLLRDFEDCVDKNDELETRIDQLKRKHAELVLNSRGIKNKISEVKNDNLQ